MPASRRRRAGISGRMRVALELAKPSGLLAVGRGLWIPCDLHACGDDPPVASAVRSQTVSVCIRRGWLRAAQLFPFPHEACVMTELGLLQLALFERVSYERLHSHAVRLRHALQQTQQYAHLIPDPDLASELSALLAVEL